MLFSRKCIFIYSCLILSNVVMAQEAETIISCPIPTIAPIAENQTVPQDGAIKIVSKFSTIEKDQLATFSGGVTLVKSEQKITADEITFNRESSEIKATGDIHYQSEELNVFADKLNVSETSNATTFDNTSYQLTNNPGNGSAGLIKIDADGTLSLMDSTFTTCVGEKPDWQLVASEINISQEDNVGEAYHARFRVFDVPVLYIPYFNFPVNNERKSGLLFPTMKSSGNSGFEFEIPYYWNIAENFDATITPHYMSKRGTQLKTEFRYLSGEQSGIIDIEYLNKDRELKANDDPRYLARFQHIGTFSENFRAYVDYTTLSDDNYLVDIGSKQYNSNDAYLYQIGEISYFGDNWQSTLKLQDFEVLGSHVKSYKTIPHLDLSARQPLPFWNGQFDIYTELTRFETPEKDLPEANRYHVETGFSFPISTPAWFLHSEFKLLQTHYQQDNLADDSKLKESVSRTLPKVRFHGGINFDRPTYLFEQQYTHTFEPQLQYLYIPDKDQSNIGIYDSSRLQDDYNGLFRDQRFNGLDRIAEANQLSWGVTNRMLTSDNAEILRFSFGQIVYINNSNIIVDEDDISDSRSALAADLFYRLNHQWQISSDLQYNTEENQTNKSQINVDYHFNKNNLIQLNHRYNRNVSGTSIEQLSLLTSIAINKDWNFVGRVTQDLQLKRSLESYAGIQYESCCWAVRLAYHRHINSNLDDDDFINENRDEFASGFMIQFVIKGLSGESSLGTQDMFNSSIFGYKRPYFLNN